MGCPQFKASKNKKQDVSEIVKAEDQNKQEVNQNNNSVEQQQNVLQQDQFTHPITYEDNKQNKIYPDNQIIPQEQPKPKPKPKIVILENYNFPNQQNKVNQSVMNQQFFVPSQFQVVQQPIYSYYPQMPQVQPITEYKPQIERIDSESSLLQQLSINCSICGGLGNDQNMIGNFCKDCKDRANCHIECALLYLSNQSQNSHNIKCPRCDSNIKIGRVVNVIEPFQLRQEQVTLLNNIQHKIFLTQLLEFQNKFVKTQTRQIRCCVNPQCPKNNSIFIYDKSQPKQHLCANCNFRQCLLCEKILLEKTCSCSIGEIEVD